MGETAGIATPIEAMGKPGSRAAWWHSQKHLLGVFLVVLWIGWFGVSLWSAPREVPAGDLRDAVQSGEVHAWDRMSRSPDGLLASTGFGSGKGFGSMVGSGGTLIEWQDTSGRRYWADGAGLVALPDTVQGASAPHALDHWMAQQGAPDRRLDAPRAPRWVGVALWSCAIAAIAFGPEPRRGNRWFWCWISSVTLGLGVLIYAVLEWVRDPKPVTRRGGGLSGLIWAFAGKTVISLGALLVGAVATRL